MTDPVELSDEELALLAAEEAQESATADPEPEPEPKQKAKRVKPAAEVDALAPTEVAVNLNPEIPAQMTYDEGPWGLLPAQMRHDADGNPVH